ncbi:MAG: putative bifunctional diguanylate cyclase/phosphodiesterase [Rhodocyclaceae bacterium]
MKTGNRLKGENTPLCRPWEMKFSTRVALLFGALGLVAMLVVMGYSVRMAEHGLRNEVRNSLEQHQRTIVSLLENRLKLLEVYLHSASARRAVAGVSADVQPVERIGADLAFMFQDASLDANLDIFFLLDDGGRLVIDAGLPLYDIGPMLAQLRAPIHYANRWNLERTAGLAALIRAAPVFDPATLNLRGTVFVGFALGQNRAFYRNLMEREQLDLLVLGHGESALVTKVSAELGLAPDEGPEALAGRPGFHRQRFAIDLAGLDEPLWLELGVSDRRFQAVHSGYLQSFVILTSGFFLLLLIAAWLLRMSHDRAIHELLDYIGKIQDGVRGATFRPTGVYEYNRVGVAMQRMVDDLNLAASVFESAEGMIVADAGWNVLRVNPAFTRITGYCAVDVVGQRLDRVLGQAETAIVRAAVLDALGREGVWQGELHGRRRSGEDYTHWTSFTAVLGADGRTVLNYVATLSDTTQRRAAEKRIEQLAYYDPLTDLPNRRLQLERLEAALAASAESGQHGAILYIDLDDFKTLNDTRGHDTGDRLLVQVAERLATCVRHSDSVGRIGGDEFVILLEDLGRSPEAAMQQAEAIASKVLRGLRKPFRIGEIEHFATLSIGIAMFHGYGEGVDDLLRQADMAMYQAKSEGRDTLCFFNPLMQSRVLQRATLESDLRQGLQRDEFTLFFQPQVDEHGGLLGAEALLRWRHPRRGLLSPGEIVPVAESSGLILPIGEWVLTRACQILAEWAHDPALAYLTLAVNVSAKQIQQPDFVEQVLEIVRRHGADPSRLKLEITESVLLDGREAVIDKMSRLKQSGLCFSLDDFGTGYSSLSYLKSLPLDQLKIDRSFVADLLDNRLDADIARTIVSLARALGLDVIAEGVETQAQRDRLQEFGCRCFQGYYFGKPVPLEKLVAGLGGVQRSGT